jgi:hypothetical protein
MKSRSDIALEPDDRMVLSQDILAGGDSAL